MEDIVALHHRLGIPGLLNADGLSAYEATWRYIDGSQGIGARFGILPGRSATSSRTMEEAKENPPAEADSRTMFGHTLAETPMERAAERERLWRRSQASGS